MKLIWVFLAVVVTINISNAKSIIDDDSEKEVKSVYSKTFNPSSYVIRRQNSSFFPSMPDKRKKFVVDLKPTVKTESQIKSAKYRKRLMKKLPIKYINYEGTSKIPVEVTTRRTLMQKRRFTVKPHDVYPESIREQYNWNNNRKININNLKKFKSDRYVIEKNTKSSNEDDSEENRFKNSEDLDINDNDFNEFDKRDKENDFIAAGSQKSGTILLFQRRNNSRYSKIHPVQKITEREQENTTVSENKISDVVNQNNDDNTDDKRKIIISTKELIKSEPKDNISDQEKADRDEFMFIKGVKENISSVPVVTVDEEVTTDSDLDIVVT